MANLSRRKPARNVACHAAPRQVVTLAATAQDRPPQITHPLAKGAQRRTVHGHPVVAEVTQQDRAQIRSLFPNGRVHAALQLFFQGPQLGLPPLPHRLAQYREMPLPGFPATVRKAQEVERLRWAVATVSSILFRISAELNDSRFVGMQLEAEARESLAQFCQKLLCFVTMFETRDKVVSETDEDHLSARWLSSPSLDPEVECVVEIEVRQQWADTAALNRSYLTLHSLALFQHARLEPFLDQAHDAPVGYAVLDKPHQPSVIESVVKLPNVGIEHPVHPPRSDPDRQCVQRLVWTTSRSESIRKSQEVLLIDRVQHLDRGPLDDFVFQRGNPELAEAHPVYPLSG